MEIMNHSMEEILQLGMEDQCKLLRKHLKGKVILFEDPFKTAGSKKIIRQLKDKMQTIMRDALFFTENPACNDFTIKLCRPSLVEESAMNDERLPQHKKHDAKPFHYFVYQENDKKEDVDISQVRRFLVELLAEDY